MHRKLLRLPQADKHARLRVLTQSRTQSFHVACWEFWRVEFGVDSEYLQFFSHFRESNELTLIRRMPRPVEVKSWLK